MTPYFLKVSLLFLDSSWFKEFFPTISILGSISKCFLKLIESSKFFSITTVLPNFWLAFGVSYLLKKFLGWDRYDRNYFGFNVPWFCLHWIIVLYFIFLLPFNETIYFEFLNFDKETVNLYCKYLPLQGTWSQLWQTDFLT